MKNRNEQILNIVGCLFLLGVLLPLSNANIDESIMWALVLAIIGIWIITANIINLVS